MADNLLWLSGTSLQKGTYAEIREFLNIENVEDLALSAWSGSSNITTVGTLSAGTVPWSLVSIPSQTAKTFLAAPNGAAGVPTFRTIVASDIPTLNQNTTGSAASLTTSRTIAISGVATGTATSFNGTANISIPITAIDLTHTGLSGVIGPDHLGTGTPDGTKFLRDDGAWVVPTAGATSWGLITGTLSSQTDLQNALNAKANIATTLAGYGINDAVATFGNQSVGGVKVFTNGLQLSTIGDATLVIDAPSANYADLAFRDGGLHRWLFRRNTNNNFLIYSYDASNVAQLRLSGNYISGVFNFTVSPTVAGNDVVDVTRTLTAGNGLTGGGTLAANRTFTLGTPSTITGTSINSVTGTSHTHELSLSYNPADLTVPISSYPTGLSTGNIISEADAHITGADSGGNRVLQIGSDANGGTGITRVFVRTSHSTLGGGGWTAPVYLFHTGNFDPATKANLAAAAFTGHISSVTASVGSTSASYGAKFSVYGATGAQTSLNVWQAGVGTGQIGFLPNDSTMRIVNSWATGFLADGLGIDILKSGQVRIGGINGVDNAFNKLAVTGGVLSFGANSQFVLSERTTTTNLWALYADSGIFRFHNGTQDVLTISTAGIVSGTGISDAASNSTLVKRTAAGYINANYFNSTSNFTGAVPTALWVETGSDGYLRKQTIDDLVQHSTVGLVARDWTVSEMLRWKNYGSNHVIFDASQGTSPSGTAVNNTDSEQPWIATYPTLMGWNGTNTYGVRVESARIADTASLLGGAAPDINENINTIVKRTSAGDVIARLLRTTYAAETTISGAIAYRVNNSTDNFTRYCSSPSAVRSWLGTAALAGDTFTGSVGASYLYSAASNGSGIRLWGDNEAFAIHMSQATNATYGGRVIGDTTSDYNMYFTMSAGTNRGFVFRNGQSSSNAVAGIDAAGNFRALGSIYSGSTIEGNRIFTGFDSAIANSISCSAWFRSNNSTGWYNQTHAVGIYATDSTYIKAYTTAKSFYAADFVSSSDIRLKKDVTSFEFNGRLIPRRFKWKRDDSEDIGFIAQEVEENYPELIGESKDDDGLMTKVVKYPKAVVILAAQVNKLTDEVEYYKERLAEIEKKLKRQR